MEVTLLKQTTDLHSYDNHGGSMRDCSVIDMFCGIGGLTHGFIKENFRVIAGFDIDESCRYAYEQNNKARFISKKIEEVKAEDILELYPPDHTRILIGCAPCQPFSKYQQKQGANNEKWKLLGAFADLIVAVQPEIVSMENVPELLRFKKGEVFDNFVEKLDKVGYHVTSDLVYCPDYGIPQERTRLVLFASKFGKVRLLEKTHTPEQYRTVRSVIGNLPPLEAGASCKNDPLHRAQGISELNLRRIKQSIPGGSWHDWDEELITECHRKKSGIHYSSVYGRMRWDEPSPTLTTECFAYGSGRFGHPEQNRALSLREAALLQTFAPTYEFVEPGSPLYFTTIGRYIGNAVPVDLGRVIAKSIRIHLESFHKSGLVSLKAESETQAVR